MTIPAMPDVKTDPEGFRAWATEHARALQLEGMNAADDLRNRAAIRAELVEVARIILWANAMPGWSPLTPDQTDYLAFKEDAEAAVDWAIRSGAILGGKLTTEELNPKEAP